MKNLLFTAAALAVISCSSKKETQSTEVVTDATEWNQKSVMAKGTVTAIQFGKDGYTATLDTGNKEIYLVTISHSNLKDPSQYKSVKIGDKLHVSGEGFGTTAEKHIIVREIMP